jgi:serine/threonine-protein kinase
VSAAVDGTLLYGAAPNPQTQTQWYARDGKPLDAVGPVAPFSDLVLSPDGQRVAFHRTDRSDAWVMDLRRGVPTQLTHMNGPVGFAWSPHGRIAFSAGAPPNLWTVDAAGTGAVVRLTTSAHTQIRPTWSPDGRAIVFSELTNDLRSTSRIDLQTLWLNADGSTRLEPYLNTPFAETEAQFSPGGEWLAYTSDESGQDEVYLQTFPRGRGKWPISSGGGISARWRRDSRELFYLTPGDVVMAVPVEARGGTLQIGTARALFSLSGLDNVYDVSPDGQRILGLAVTGGTAFPTLTLVVNWPALRHP